jgi:signal transduction histidine kinase
MEQLLRFTRVAWPVAVGVGVFALGLTAPRDNPISALATTGEGYYAPYNLSALLFVAALSGIAAAFGWRRLWPVLVMAAVGWAFMTMYGTVAACSYFAAIHLRRRWAAITYLSLSSAAIIAPVIIGMSKRGAVNAGIVGAVVGAGLLVAMPYTIGLYQVARAQIVDGLRERAARLEREQAVRADQARAEERTRIAREMHDVVAHRVSLMVLHAGVMEVSTADARLAGEAALIRTTGREALTELRQVLGVLRDDCPAEVDLVPQPDLSDLPALLARIRAAGLPTRYVQDGEPGTLPAVVQRTTYRVIQEALTNVIKHNGRVDTVVTVRFGPQTVEVRVENAAPPGPVERPPASGIGLIGLRERVELLSGRFDAGQRLDGGFAVHAILPTIMSDAPA